MQRQLAYFQGTTQDVNHGKYLEKMNQYEVVFDAVIEDFNNSMFGLYSNSVTREVFQK